jgi:hypothetical protein
VSRVFTVPPARTCSRPVSHCHKATGPCGAPANNNHQFESNQSFNLAQTDTLSAVMVVANQVSTLGRQLVGQPASLCTPPPALALPGWLPRIFKSKSALSCALELGRKLDHDKLSGPYGRHFPTFFFLMCNPSSVLSSRKSTISVNKCDEKIEQRKGLVAWMGYYVTFSVVGCAKVGFGPDGFIRPCRLRCRRHSAGSHTYTGSPTQLAMCPRRQFLFSVACWRAGVRLDA